MKIIWAEVLLFIIETIPAGISAGIISLQNSNAIARTHYVEEKGMARTDFLGDYSTPQEGITCQSSGIANIAGIASMISTYEIISPSFTVNETGMYLIRMTGEITGEITEGSSASFPGGVSKSGGQLTLNAGIQSQGFNTVKFYETDFGKWALLKELTWATIGVLLDRNVPLLSSESLSTIRDHLTPTISWENEPFSINSYVHLNENESYNFTFFIYSSVAAGGLGLNIKELVLFDILASNLSAEIELLYPTGPPPAPESVWASDGEYNEGVLISWTPVLGATSYVIYRGSSKDQTIAQKIGYTPDGTTNSFWDEDTKPGYGYLYWVRAECSDPYRISSFDSYDYGYSSIVPGHDFYIDSISWRDIGDKDGVIECGDRAEIRISLGTYSETSQIKGLIYSTNPTVEIWDDTNWYPPMNRDQISSGDGGYTINLNCSTGRTIDFNLRLSYQKNQGEYFQEFPITYHIETPCESCWSGFSITDILIDDTSEEGGLNKVDGIFQSGEQVRFRPVLKNTGITDASGVDLWIFCNDPGIEILSTQSRRYPILHSQQESIPTLDRFFKVFSKQNYSGKVEFGVRIQWDEGQDKEFLIPNAFSVYVGKLAWILAQPDKYVVENIKAGIKHEVLSNITNYGSDVLIVENYSKDKQNTQLIGPELPWAILPGDSLPFSLFVETGVGPGPLTEDIHFHSNGIVNTNYYPPTNTISLEFQVIENFHCADNGSGSDQPNDGIIGDWELLHAIDVWMAGDLMCEGPFGDFDLLHLIDLWAQP